MSAQEPGIRGEPAVRSMQLSFGTDGNAIYRPVSGGGGADPVQPIPFTVRPCGTVNGGSGGGGGDGFGEQSKKKRGRPRKYVADMAAVTVQPINAVAPGGVGGVSVSMGPALGGFSSGQNHVTGQQQNHEQHVLLSQEGQQDQQQGGELSGKKRGRPPGSVNRKQHRPRQQHQEQRQEQAVDALGAPGIGFTPHVITVNTGEDVSSKIMSFSQNGPRAICILSANGTISSVTLRQSATSGGSVTYEGRFEILSLSGSFMFSEKSGGRSRTGGISVSLSGPDGRVIGGGVAGLLTAASPIQVVVGSFIADGRKDQKIQSPREPLFTPSRLHTMTGAQGLNSPQSHGTLSESSDGPDSPPNQSGAALNSNPAGLSNLPWK